MLKQTYKALNNKGLYGLEKGHATRYPDYPMESANFITEAG